MAVADYTQPTPSEALNRLKTTFDEFVAVAATADDSRTFELIQRLQAQTWQYMHARFNRERVAKSDRKAEVLATMNPAQLQSVIDILSDKLRRTPHNADRTKTYNYISVPLNTAKRFLGQRQAAQA